MRHLYYFSLFFLPFSIEAIQQVSLEIGYAHTDCSFGFSQTLFQQIEEDWHDVSSVITGLEYSYKEPDYIESRTAVTYSNTLSDHGSCFLKTGLPEEASATFSHKLRGYSYSLEERLGYPFRLGAIYWSPLAGFFFESICWKRKNLSKKMSSAGTFFPQKRIHVRNIMPLVGLNVSYQPWRSASFLIDGSYAYQFGAMRLESSYERNGNTTKEKVEEFSGIHDATIRGLLRISHYAYIGIAGSYRKQKAKEKTLSRGKFTGMTREVLAIKTSLSFVF
ncbi:MAG: hypothetical protein AAGI90_00225 [Chlamydiota bacterium]